MRVIKSLFFVPLLLLGQADPLVEGLGQFRQGKYLEAEKSFTQALEKADEPRARTFLALSRAATGRCAAVEADLRREAESNTDKDLRRLAGLGYVQCLMAGNDYLRAAGELTKLQKEHPGDADVLYQTARVHMEAWNDTIHKMFREAPASYRVNQISAEILEIQGKYSEAISEYQKAIEKNPTAVNLHYRLARATLMESHDPSALEAARVEFELELKLNPRDAVAHYQVGQILLAQQKREEGIARIQRAIELQPDFSRALVALGKVRMDDKDFGEAVKLLEEAVRIAPDSEAARYGLMRAYRRAGRQEDALKQKEELEKLQRPPEGEFADFLKRIGEKPEQPEPQQ